MWDNGGRNIKLDQAKFTDMGLLSRDSAFNVAGWKFRKSCNSVLVKCLEMEMDQQVAHVSE